MKCDLSLRLNKAILEVERISMQFICFGVTEAGQAMKTLLRQSSIVLSISYL